MISEEKLVQRCHTLPPHSLLAIGAATEPRRTQFVVHEIVSQFSVGSLKGDRAGNLLEFREIVSKNHESVQTPAAARAALAMDISSGEDRVRKKILEEFTRLGLADVAIDYGLILLAFTRLDTLELRPAGLAWIRDDATVDFVLSSFGCVTPATVVHRHLVDLAVLTENLYTYSPFRLFTSESTIGFSDPAATEKK